MSDRLHGLESLEALLAPEQLLPAQFAHARRDSVMCGERALMLAVLEDAIRCLEDGTRRESLLVRETLAWIRADDHEWPFSFLNLCANLEIDAGSLRRELLRRAARRRAPAGKRGRGGLHRRRHPQRESRHARPRVEPRPGAADLPRRAAQG
jgi:hypothetical protein